PCFIPRCSDLQPSQASSANLNRLILDQSLGERQDIHYSSSRTAERRHSVITRGYLQSKRCKEPRHLQSNRHRNLCVCTSSSLPWPEEDHHGVRTAEQLICASMKAAAGSTIARTEGLK
ncbi:unnamed protein product, partial [Heterosigma akashiwo]